MMLLFVECLCVMSPAAVTWFMVLMLEIQWQELKRADHVTAVKKQRERNAG